MTVEMAEPDNNNWIVTKDGMPLTGMMGCADAHNHAASIKCDDEE